MVKKQNEFGGINPFVYPMIIVGTIDGISEVIEHRRAGNIYYISDDPELIKAINQP